MEYEVIEFECPNCHKAGQFETAVYIDASDPMMKEKILDQSVFTYVCPQCQSNVLIFSPCLVYDEEKKLIVEMQEEGKEEDPFTVYVQYRKITDPLKMKEIKDHWTMRIVHDPNELMEKVLIREEGLDDREVEIVKLFLSARLLEQKPDWNVQKLFFSVNDEGWELAVITDEGFAGSVALSEEMLERVRSEILPLIDEEKMNEQIIDQAWAINAMREADEDKTERKLS